MFSKRKVVKKNIKKSLADDSGNGDEGNLFKGPLNEENNAVGQNEKENKINNNVSIHEEGIVSQDENDLSEIKKNAAPSVMPENRNINDACNDEATMGNQQSDFKLEKNEKQKKKMSFIERKKKEEMDRVNKLNTSFNIYSDHDSGSDSENYIMIKKKKKNMKKKFAGINSNDIYKQKENIEKINSIKDGAQNDEQYYQKYITNRYSMHTKEGDSDENDAFTMRETEGGINEMDGDSPYSYNGVKGDKNFQNISQMNNNYKNKIATDNSLLGQENEQLYGDQVIINFEDEMDDENDEENKLIKEIKLKKNIIRKKKEISEKYLFEYEENSNDDCEKLYPYDYSYAGDNASKKNIFSNEINNFENEDDFELDDTYNYETLKELKYKLLIKKNKNEGIGNLYEKSKHDQESEIRKDSSNDELESKGKYDTSKLYKSYTNYDNISDDNEENENHKIKKIINRNIFKELTNEKKKMEFLASSNYDDNLNEDIYMSDKSTGNIPTKNEKTNELNKVKADENGKVEKGHTLNNIDEKVLKNKDDIGDISFYNCENENMFENIKKNFEEYGVCNLEIVKMNNDIKKEYENYKSRIKNYENKKRLEQHNNIEYKKLKKICKIKKKQFITCIYINKFIAILKNLILEKSKCIDNALKLLYKMESSFTTIYFNMKLYIYKEYYEHHKLKFIDDYIFNSKFYKIKKNKYKSIYLNYLIKEDNFIHNQNDIHTLILFYNNFIKNIYNYNYFDKTSYHYMLDGFSSNYSTDSSNVSEGDGKVVEELDDSQPNFKDKTKNEKTKYFQTIKMKDIKNKFLSLIENIFENVNLYFLNFKSVIKYFYLFKYYNNDFYKNNNCLECFEDIFFFFVKLELLYWDPILQFSLKKKKKNNKLDIYDKQIKSDAFMIDKDDNEEIENITNGSNENVFPHFNYNNLFINSDNDDNQLLDSSDESESEISVSSSSCTDEESVNNNMTKRESENSNEENNINFENINKIHPTFKKFRKNPNFEKKKYKLNKKCFNTSPFIKSFEWYKFMDELILIYDVTSEKEILKNLYKNIFNNKIYELIDNVWNPFSLNQSINLVAIIKDYITYNDENDLLFLKIRKRVCIYINTYLETRKNIMNQKKRNIFLIRCLKLFKCIKNILTILHDKELYQILQKVFYDIVLTNCDYSNKYHNLILASLIPIIQSVNMSYNNNFDSDMSEIMNKVISNLASDGTCFTTLHIDH
ncbi:conserved Plasmodium protein, unknown function [Plasmodium chabaudi adami]|uniref:Uncharacterized protein n=1 Tax=Plasmodium chabaudi adami TaxID=5826 RepID=A0A1C6YG69_PLACE|nr:conserved Plasmodium protein, unknown function [Plasmodium chabaudi adami]